MPGGDRTGPMGMGARSGRGRGYCTGFNRADSAPGFAPRGYGGGGGRAGRFRLAAGRGGWGNPFFTGGRMAFGADPDRQLDDKAALERRSRDLQSELDAVNKELDEMKQETQHDNV